MRYIIDIYLLTYVNGHGLHSSHVCNNNNSSSSNNNNNITIIIIIVIMFIMLSSCSWHVIVRVHPVHLMNVERCQPAANPQMKSADLGRESNLGCYHLYPPSPKADTHFTVPWRGEGWVDLGTLPYVVVDYETCYVAECDIDDVCRAAYIGGLSKHHVLLTSPTSITTNGTADDDLLFYLSVYGGLAGANSFLTLIRAFLFAYGGIEAAVVLHSRLLAAILTVLIFIYINFWE